MNDIVNQINQLHNSDFFTYGGGMIGHDVDLERERDGAIKVTER